MGERESPGPNFFDGFKQYIADTMRLVSLTYEGVHRIHKLPDLFIILNSVNTTPGEEDSSTRAQDLEENAQLAAEEIGSDFALLHAHSLIGVWGALEAMVDNAADYYLQVNRQASLERPVFQRIKISAASYELMSGQERRAFLINEAKRESKADLSMGLGQFEKVLHAIGLEGPVDPRIRNTLFEAQQIRNVIAHRGGRADSQFLERCPNLSYGIGDPVSLNRSQFHDIVVAMALYARTVLRRVLLAVGADDDLNGIPVEYVNAPGLGGETVVSRD
jgi:hypothetical protein